MTIRSENANENHYAVFRPAQIKRKIDKNTIILYLEDLMLSLEMIKSKKKKLERNSLHAVKTRAILTLASDFVCVGINKFVEINPPLLLLKRLGPCSCYWFGKHSTIPIHSM
jgi:hypothetical protein